MIDVPLPYAISFTESLGVVLYTAGASVWNFVVHDVRVRLLARWGQYVELI
jgi:hypothetical protein